MMLLNKHMPLWEEGRQALFIVQTINGGAKGPSVQRDLAILALICVTTAGELTPTRTSFVPFFYPLRRTPNRFDRIASIQF